MARLYRAVVPETADLLRGLGDNDQPQRQLSALSAASARAGSFSPAAQLDIIEALKKTAAAQGNAAVVRGAAVDSLGLCALRLKNAAALRAAVVALTDVAHAEPLAPFRLNALLTLSRFTDHMPWIDRRADGLVVLTALDGAARAGSARERELSMMIFYNIIQARGPDVIDRFPVLRDRTDAELLAPLENDLNGYYRDARNDVGSRYFLMGSLRWMAGKRESADERLSERVRRVFGHMAQADPDASLKRLATLYNEELQAGPKR
jgi:hypothetical protein